MKEYRKIATIRAVQYMGQSVPGVCTGPHGPYEVCTPHIHTLEGDLTPSKGDWIATGVQGEHWAIKPDVFAATYAEVTDKTPAQEELPALTYDDCTKADADAAEQYAVAYVREVGVSGWNMIDAVSTLRAQVMTYDRTLKEKDAEIARLGRISSKSAKAIQAFRNIPMLKNMLKLRETPEYAELCAAWVEHEYVTDSEDEIKELEAEVARLKSMGDQSIENVIERDKEISRLKGQLEERRKVATSLAAKVSELDDLQQCESPESDKRRK